MEQIRSGRWFSGLVLLALGLGLIFPLPVGAFDLLPIRVSSLDIPQGAAGCAISGNYCYVAAGKAGLLVVDVSNPSQPKQVGAHATEEDAVGVSLGDGIACVSQYFGGVEILDIRDPQHPSKLGTIPDFLGDARSFVRSNLVYIVEGGLSIIDISDPSNPKKLGGYSYPRDGEDQSLSRLSSVALEGSFAFCTGTFGLSVFDVKDPAHTEKVAEVQTEAGEGVGIVVFRNYAYLAALWGGIQVFDISDPIHPVWIYAVNTFGMASTICMSNDHLVVGAQNGSVSVFDISDGKSPQSIGLYEASSAINGVAALGNHFVVAHGVLGLASIQLTPANVWIRNDASEEGGPLAVSAGVAVMGSPGLIRVLDVSDPQHARVRGELETGMGTPDDLQIFGSSACYINWNGNIDDGGDFRIIDIRDPAHPRRLGSYSSTCFIQHFALAGTLAYLAADTCGLEILDLANPVLPELVGKAPTAGVAQHVSVANGIAYLASGVAGLELVDVHDPRNPSRVGHTPLGGKAELVAIAAAHAYVVLEEGPVDIVDVSDPHQPRRVGNYPFSKNTQQLLVSGQLLYLLSSFGGIEVLDIREPANPRRVGGNLASRSLGARIAENLGTVWISGYGSGFVTPLGALSRIQLVSEHSGSAKEQGIWLYGIPGEQVDLEWSADLQSWIPWQTVTLGEAPLRVTPRANKSVEFYREATLQARSHSFNEPQPSKP